MRQDIVVKRLIVDGISERDKPNDLVVVHGVLRLIVFGLILNILQRASSDGLILDIDLLGNDGRLEIHPTDIDADDTGGSWRWSGSGPSAWRRELLLGTRNKISDDLQHVFLIVYSPPLDALRLLGFCIHNTQSIALLVVGYGSYNSCC